MTGMRMRVATLCLCLLGFATAAPIAAAEDGTSGDEIVDVSKQVSAIQKKLDDLRGRGRWAKAGDLLESAACEYGEPSEFFKPWGDDSTYMLAPQGDLSSTDGWTLDKKAVVDPSGDPFSGTGRSLRFGNGAEAATPAMCVDLDHPTIRFFVRDAGGNEKSHLRVEVLYEDFGGHVKRLTVARVRAESTWRPSAIVPMYMNMLALASPSGVTAVAFRFKAEGLQKSETISISSLYVDPFRSR